MRLYYKPLCEARGLFPVAFDIGWGGSLTKFKPLWLDNPFLAPGMQEVMLTLLQVAAKYLAVVRRCVVRRIRRNKTSKNSTDLEMNPISAQPEARLFHVYEAGCKYSFTLQNALKLVMTSITANIEIISAPVHTVNPYTRRPFTEWTFYLLFLRLKESTFLMPPLLYGFIKCHCELARFVLHYECQLRDFNITKYVDNMPPKEVNFEVRDMFATVRAFHNRSHTLMRNWNLLPERCLKYFKPWLYLYMTYVFTLNPYMKANAYNKLSNAIVLFLAKNPEFGVKKNHVVYADIKTPVPRERL